MPSISSDAPTLTSSAPYWGLVDCNNFYASCEKLFRPDLAHSPVVVLSNNDGCIVARSSEAKALGIPGGEPEFRVRALLRAQKVAVFSSNYALYGDISHRVMSTLEALCPHVEPYSIDEAFIRVDNALVSQATDFALHVRQTIQQWVGITVSVGIAPTRTLAKLANKIAKKSGICILSPGPTLEVTLRDFPIEDIWGIGRRQSKKLHSMGISTALHLRNADEALIRRHFTITGWKTQQELRGIPCINEDEGHGPRKSIIVSRSFGQKMLTLEPIDQAVATFAARAGEKLRKGKLLASAMLVYISTGRHDKSRHYESAQLTFTRPTADTLILQSHARRLLAQIYKPGPAYAKAGIMLFDLIPPKRQQGLLLPQPEALQDVQRQTLMATMDTINQKFGRRSVHFGSEGPEKAVWHMRQEHRSPRMTSNWDELAVAKCK